MLRTHLRPAIVLTLLLCLLTGLLYPGVVTGLAQLLFPWESHGSLVTANGRVVGSALIGQPFTRPEYFHPRPSAAGQGYDATASAGTNKGPTDRKLADTLIAGAVAQAVEEDGAVRGRIPADMVTASASGLDPHISPANAELQIARVARARSIPVDSLRAVVRRHTEARQLGFLGEPRVNVLLLNVALDSLAPVRGVSLTAP
jgi:K+-transporting ATPase ATPase C chain